MRIKFVVAMLFVVFGGATVWAGETEQDIINRYDIRYIVVGNLERSTYRVNEEKFNSFLKPIYQQGSITIYEVP